MSQRLLISSASILNELFFINNSSRLYYALVPIMEKVQRDIVAPCFTSEKFAEIIGQLSSRTLSAENSFLLDLARDAMAFMTMSTAVITMQPEVFPEGIFNNYISLGGSSKTAASSFDRTKLSDALKQYADNALNSLQAELTRIACELSGETYEPEDLLPKGEPEDKFISL
jgi:hypothetical protein